MMAGAVERGIQKARRRMPETREEKMARFILKNVRVFLIFTRGGIYTRKAKRRSVPSDIITSASEQTTNCRAGIDE